MIYFSLENKFTSGNSHFGNGNVMIKLISPVTYQRKSTAKTHQSEVLCSLDSSSCCTIKRYKKVFIIMVKRYSFL